MIRSFGTLFALLSAIFFPWPFTACFALGMALYEPLVPLTVGLFSDTLYYTSHGAQMPFFTLAGAFVTAAAFFVRNRLKTGIIEG